jgi:predicted negative regulator of RcsB-dependent stress response
MADEASAIVEATEYLVWQGDAHEVRGLIRAAAGRIDEAVAAFREALERYERKGAIPAAERIRSRLGAL